MTSTTSKELMLRIKLTACHFTVTQNMYMRNLDKMDIHVHVQESLAHTTPYRDQGFLSKPPSTQVPIFT